MSVSKSFLFPALLKDLAPNVQALGLLVSTMSWGPFWKLRSVTRHFFGNSDYDHEFFENFLSVFPKQSRCYLTGSHGDPQAEQSTLVMVLRKLEWKLDFRALARSCTEGPSIVAAIGTSRVRWSMVRKDNNINKKKKHKDVSVWSWEVSTLHHLQTSEFWGACFRDPDVATVLHFAVIVYVDVQLQDGQAAARGKRRKAVTRDVSGVDHRGVTNLSSPISFTGQGIAPFFVTWRNFRCWFCVRKALWRCFYPRSRKRDHFQTLATGVPKLKTWLGTQWDKPQTLFLRATMDVNMDSKKFCDNA